MAAPGTVVRADRTGPAQLLAVLPEEAPRVPAEMLLAPLSDADRDRTLLRTLATLLDVGTAPSAVAARLGVHRNTVIARLDRLRALGCDPDDPDRRIALHIACRVLLNLDKPRSSCTPSQPSTDRPRHRGAAPMPAPQGTGGEVGTSQLVERGY